MLKISLLIAVIFIASVLGARFLGKRAEQEKKQARPGKVSILFYRNGERTELDSQSPGFDDVIAEAERLFTTASGSYRLIMNAERIAGIKKQVALELVYPDVQLGKTQKMSAVYFTKLLIPLTGQFSNGVVFFAGAPANSPGGQQPVYSSLMEYGSDTFVVNSEGLDKLNSNLKKMGLTYK